MEISQLEGLVLKNYNNFYYIKSNNNIYECKPRGKLKKDKIVSGDKVMFTPLEASRGVLESRLPRQNELYRPRIANVSAALIVMANDKPAPDLMLLDRLLLLVQYNRLEACIILNKSDLDLDRRAEQIKTYYAGNGFKVFATCASSYKGIDTLLDAIAGKVVVLSGPSGVGKSSLLNAMLKSAVVKTAAVSEKIGRGKQTTTHVEIFPLTNGAFIADTPGFSVLDLPPVRREELADYYPDFQDFREKCRFSNCLHYREVECGVKNAVKENKIAQFRYNNYVHMLEEIIARERCYR